MKYFRYLITTFFVIINLSSYAKEFKVLNIASYHKGYYWTDTCTNGIENNLDKSKYEIINFYCDTKRLSKDKFDESFSNAWQKYLEIKPDIVLIGDDNALKSLGKKFATVNTPVMFYGINNNPRQYFIDGKMPENIIGLRENQLHMPMIRSIGRIDRSVKSILAVADESASAKAKFEEIFHGKSIQKMGNMQINFVMTNDWIKWQKMLDNSSSKYDAILLVNIATVTKNNLKITPEEIVNYAGLHANIPIYVNLPENFLGVNKGVGTLLLSGIEHGKKVALMSKEILENNIATSKIPSRSDTRGNYIFSKSALAKYKLNLPKNIERITKFVD